MEQPTFIQVCQLQKNDKFFNEAKKHYFTVAKLEFKADDSRVAVIHTKEDKRWKPLVFEAYSFGYIKAIPK